MLPLKGWGHSGVRGHTPSPIKIVTRGSEGRREKGLGVENGREMSVSFRGCPSLAWSTSQSEVCVGYLQSQAQGLPLQWERPQQAAHLQGFGPALGSSPQAI